jgi:hypothetical protein
MKYLETASNSMIILLWVFVLCTWSLSGTPFCNELSGQRNAWESRGIGGGGAFYSPTISPFDGEIIYLATDMSATFRTDDFGRSWTTLDFREIQGGVNSHIRFTHDPDVVYAINRAEDSGTPVRSNDGGETWMPLPSDPTYGEAFSLFADPNSTERILLSGWDELHLSDDGGSNFSLVHTASNQGAGLHMAGVFWDGLDIYVGTNDGILVSDDGGLTFNVCFTFSYGEGIPDDEAMVSFAGAKENGTVRFFTVTMGEDDVWAGITGSEFWGYCAIYRVDWGIGEWMPVTTGIPDNEYPFFVAMAQDDIDTVFVAGSDADAYAPMVYRSTNGGESWSDVFLTLHNSNITTGWCGDGGDTEWWYPEYALGFAVSPSDPTRVVITDLGFVHVSETAGESWRQAYVHEDDENPAGNDTPSGSAYRGIGLENTSGWWLQWAGQDTIIAALTDIRGMRSIDGGSSWTAGSSLGLPHNTTYHIAAHEGSGILYAATSTVHDLYQSTHLRDAEIDGGGGYLLISQDKGASWQVLHDFEHPVVWLAIDPDDQNTVYASVVHSTQGDIYVTHDLNQGTGASWTRLASPPRTEGHPFVLHILDDGTLVCSYSGRRDSGGSFTQSSGVFLSTNGGAAWEDRSDQGMERWTKDVVIDAHDPLQNTWYAAVFSHWGSYPNEVGGLYRTTDRGLAWDRINELYRVESITAHPWNPDTAFISTETSGLWMTEELSSPSPTFEQIDGYPFRHPVRIFYEPGNAQRIWTTSFGGGLRVTDTGSVSCTDAETRPKAFLISPNPSKATVQFVVETETPSEIRLSVFDLHGRCVKTIKDSRFEAGRWHLSWDGRDDRGRLLGNGTYLCRSDETSIHGSETIIRIR